MKSGQISEDNSLLKGIRKLLDEQPAQEVLGACRNEKCRLREKKSPLGTMQRPKKRKNGGNQQPNQLFDSSCPAGVLDAIAFADDAYQLRDLGYAGRRKELHKPFRPSHCIPSIARFKVRMPAVRTLFDCMSRKTVPTRDGTRLAASDNHRRNMKWGTESMWMSGGVLLATSRRRRVRSMMLRRRRTSGANSASMYIFKQNECGSEIGWGRTVIRWMMTLSCPSEKCGQVQYLTPEIGSPSTLYFWRYLLTTPCYLADI